MSAREDVIDRIVNVAAADLRKALQMAYDVGYREGDLDRQRFERSIVKPKRARASRGET